MAKVKVTRTGNQDAFGDPDPDSVQSFFVDGAKIGWTTTTQDTDHKAITIRRVSLFFRRSTPDIQDDDQITLPDGKVFWVEGVDAWEHARIPNVIAGTEVILRTARTRS